MLARARQGKDKEYICQRKDVTTLSDILGTTFTAIGLGVGGVTQAGIGGFQALDFGKKGTLIGAGLGLGGFAVGKGIESSMQDEHGNNTYAGVALGAIATGTIQSAYSTAKELEAFKKTNSVAALSSINSTTSNVAITKAIDDIFSRDGWKKRTEGQEGLVNKAKSLGFQSFTRAMQTPFANDNFSGDAIRMGMITGNGLDESIKNIGMRFNKTLTTIGTTEEMDDTLRRFTSRYREAKHKRNMADIGSEGALKDMNDTDKRILDFYDNNETFRKVADSYNQPFNPYDSPEEQDRKTKEWEKGKHKFVKQYQETGDLVTAKVQEKMEEYEKAGKKPKIKEIYEEAAGQVKGADFYKNSEDIYDMMKSDELKSIVSGDKELRYGRTSFMTSHEVLKNHYGDSQNKDGVLKRLYKGAEGYVQDNWAAAEAKTPWFYSEGAEYNGKKLGANEDFTFEEEVAGEKKKITMNTNDSMEKRMQKYIDLRADEVDKMVDGLEKGAQKINDHQDLKKYVDTLEPGALGTYKSLERAGLYGEDSNWKRKTIAFGVESFTGSPLWARVSDRQINKHVEERTKGLNLKAGEILSDKQMEFRNEAIKELQNGKLGGGKGKAMRAAAILGDTVGLGGGLFAAGAVAHHTMMLPFQKDGGDQSVQSNNAYRPA